MNARKPALRLIACLALCSYFACARRAEKIDKITEDGVEVILNHLEPYKLAGEPSGLSIEREFSIDTEKDETARTGLVDVEEFDVDSERNIYCFQARENDRNVVYKFDREGHLALTLGKRGQGPDEIQAPVFLAVTENDEILIQDNSGPRLVSFDRDGNILGRTRLMSKSPGQSVFFPLANGNFLKYADTFDPSTKHRFDVFDLYDAKFERIKELDRSDYGPVITFTQEKKRGSPRVFIAQLSDGIIYLGNESRGHELLIYDPEGRLSRKVRKEHIPADVPDEFKENLLINFGRYKDRVIIPDKMPPFHYFFLDDEGRVYVKTYERSTNVGEWYHDIFNCDGIFILRASLPGYGSWMGPGRSQNRAKARNGRFYCIREKASGYKELVVFKMVWSTA